MELLLNGSTQGVLEGNETTDSFFVLPSPIPLPVGNICWRYGQRISMDRYLGRKMDQPDSKTDANVSIHAPLIGETLKPMRWWM